MVQHVKSIFTFSRHGGWILSYDIGVQTLNIWCPYKSRVTSQVSLLKTLHRSLGDDPATPTHSVSTAASSQVGLFFL